MNTCSMNNSNKSHWFVCSKREHNSDRLKTFFDQGIWQYFDNEVKENTRYNYRNYLCEVTIGNRISIYENGNETSDEFNANHQFEIAGKFITHLEIKAVGKVTKPCNDDWIVGVNWEKVSNSGRWYRYTYKGQIWRVRPNNKNGWGKNLIEFTLEGAAQNLTRLYSEL